MRLFISYARVDKPIVRQIVDLLSTGDHEPWYDHQLIPGEAWEAQLIEAIRSSDALVYVLTPESVASSYCQWEFKQAVEMGKLIMPVLAQAKTELTEALKKLEYVDFTDGATANNTARLLGGLSSLARKLPKKAVAAVPDTPTGIPSRVDELYETAVQLAYDRDGISLGVLKRELNIGYDRARNLMEMMQQRGVVGEYPGGGKLHPLL